MWVAREPGPGRPRLAGIALAGLAAVADRSFSSWLALATLSFGGGALSFFATLTAAFAALSWGARPCAPWV